jgi:eukaryotic-like serine/threonine-protein kinase
VSSTVAKTNPSSRGLSARPNADPGAESTENCETNCPPAVNDGGAPRELLDHVIAADWSRDGAQLAVARSANGKCRLEYPIGNILYESIDWISHMRISPQGDAIAFMDHPLPADDRGTVALVDLKGNKRTLTPEWPGEQGLAWSPDGSEIWFTATSRSDWERDLYAVSRSGKQRLVLQTPVALYLEDIASDGRVLLRHEVNVRSICHVNVIYIIYVYKL